MLSSSQVYLLNLEVDIMLKYKCLMICILSLMSMSVHAVPPNARATANGWECNVGFKRQAQQCNKIYVPPNAVVRGQGWVCRSGFVRTGQQCNVASGQTYTKPTTTKTFDDLLDQLKTNKSNRKKAVEAAVEVYKQGKFKQAFKMFHPLAKKKDPRAQFYMGVMHGKGEGVLKDQRKAAEWLFVSAKQNYPFAQFNLGNIYRSGKGVPKDFKKSVYWYQRSAKQGHRAALHYLGLAYYLGRGVLKDEQRGLDLIRQSAIKGDRESQYFLGISYCSGKSVILSKRQCAIWIKRAYDRGHPKASAIWEKHQLWKHQ